MKKNNLLILIIISVLSVNINVWAITDNSASRQIVSNFWHLQTLGQTQQAISELNNKADDTSLMLLSYVYQQGIGVEENSIKSQQYCTKIEIIKQTKANKTQHLFALGLNEQYGLCSSQNNEKMLHWYRLSAQQANDVAMYFLGVISMQGIAVKKDKQEAMKWFKKSAEQGNILAQYNLASMYANQLGEIKKQSTDDKKYHEIKEKSIKWYTKAHEQGYKKATQMLFILFEIKIQDN